MALWIEAQNDECVVDGFPRLGPGTVIARRYRIMRFIANGNFARVFAGYDLVLHKRIAIKVLHRDLSSDAKAEKTILEAIRQLDPGNKSGCVTLIDSVDHQGNSVFIMELKGASLRSRLSALSRADIADLVVDVSASLYFLHGKVRAVHTDLKPENIVAEPGPGPRKWGLCDFGSSSFVKPGKEDHDLITTRMYRAPEVVAKSTWSFAADVWSLGCILYEACMGKPLFQHTTDKAHLAEMAHKLGPLPQPWHEAMMKLEGTPIDFADIPTLREELAATEPALYHLLTRMLTYDPERRARPEHILVHPFTTLPSSKTMDQMSSAASSSIDSARPLRKRLRT